MAVEQVQNLPQQYVTDLGKDYGTQLAGLTSIPLDTARLAPQVAGQDALQQQAYNLASSGVGAFQPYLTQAGAYDTAAQQFGTQAAGTLAGASALGTQALGSLADAGTFGTAAAGYSGPSAYSQFMSPYQQDVINASLAEFDTQAAKGLSGIGQLAAQSGNLGGGREGVMRSEYQSESDRNRALLNAQLLQQGFGQANQLANQAFGQQQNLANLQLGIADRERNLAGLEVGIADRERGLGDQSLSLSKNQQALAGLLPGLQTADINQLGRLGGLQQIQEQAILDAQREANRLEAYEPYERLGTYGSGVASLFSGNAPFGSQSTITPNPTPLQTALGTGAVLSGIFGGGNKNMSGYLPFIN